MRIRILGWAAFLAVAGVSTLAISRACDCLAGSGDFASSAELALDPFRSDGAALTDRDYERLFAYFVQGFSAYKSDHGSRASYPGWPMGEGSSDDEAQQSLEGFTRIAPLLAAWLHSGRRPLVSLSDGTQVDIRTLLREGLVNGTDQVSPGYWGTMTSSKIVEAADVALALWLSREALWDQLPISERQQLASWLYDVNGKDVADNNWHLFVVLVNVVLNDLGMPADLVGANQHYQRFKSFYLGQGWFRDGRDGEVDYYNAWGIHYPLYWVRVIDSQWDREFLVNALAEFSSSFKYFFGPHGIPIMGRSVCYRGGASAPLIMASIEGTGSVSPGEARRTLDLTWSFLVRNGAVAKGTVTQGYCGDDPRVLDYYSGAASCLWSLRSLVVALSLPVDSSFWRTQGESLPVERGDFVLSLAAIGWTVVGDSRTRDVSIRVKANENNPAPRMLEYSLLRRVSDAILCRSRRPENVSAKYEAAIYSSAEPFCGCLSN